MTQQASLLDQIDICESRHRGSPESAAAFEKIAGSKQAMYDRILNFARGQQEGITVHEVAAAFGKTPNCVSGRLSELRMLGKLKKSGQRRNGAAVLLIEGR